MTEHKIDKDIPIPEAGNKGAWPFAKMAIGDSLFEKGATSSGQSKLRAGAAGWGARQTPKAKFIGRKVEGGVRVWRTE